MDNQVFGWTPDGKEVLFKSHRVPWSDRIGRPYLGMHYPSDVLAGALLGTALGLALPLGLVD